MRNNTIIDYTTTLSNTPDPTIPWDTYVILFSVFGIFLCGLISIGGLLANALVITVFHRQGIMAESSTVSLFALAVADFLIELTHVVMVTARAVQFVEHYGIISSLYIDPAMVENLCFRAKIFLGHTSCWLTAYLSFERCFSVLFPFKVKSVFAPKNSLIALVSIYFGSFVTFLPLTLRFGVIELTINNRTILTQYQAAFLGLDLAYLAVLINPLILRPIGISIVIVCNMIISIKVKWSKKWRKSVTAVSSSGDSSNEKSKRAQNKEGKLIKMIYWISGIFLMCTTPDIVLVFLTRMRVAMVDSSVRNVGYGIVFFAESINSAINIIVYYTMSTNFKKEFRRLFKLSKE